jgi:hypothetical protein
MQSVNIVSFAKQKLTEYTLVRGDCINSFGIKPVALSLATYPKCVQATLASL